MAKQVCAAIIGAVLTLTLIGCGLHSTRVKEQVPVSEGLAAEALKVALSQVGTPYVYGGRDPQGFDCSGLIVWSYRQAVPDLQLRWAHRIAVDVNMDELWRYNVLPLGILDLRPGDLVFITSEEDRITHGGLFVRWVREGELELVNASSYAGEVTLDTWPISGTKRGQWFAGGGRLLMAR